MMSVLVSIFFVALLSVGGSTTVSNPTIEPSCHSPMVQDIPVLSPNIHVPWEVLLRKYVNSQGKVDYKNFQKDKIALANYLQSLQQNAPKSHWTKQQEMAYWINLYNAFTIQIILDHYPVKSIMDIDGGKVWERKTITIAGEKLTLNTIEKKKLLQHFKDGRIHFAVNCAAASCPPLLNKAWTADNIQRYLQQQAKAFINNTQYNQLSENTVQISQIFNWYADDFGGRDRLVAYLQKYTNTRIKDKAKVTFRAYDWSLNK